jgi:3-oxoacyl-[acyl-carrier-protein] synthase II
MSDLCPDLLDHLSGLLIGEGAGSMILERESHAKKRGANIFGVFSGYGISNDAYHATQPHPDAVGGILAIQRALEDSQLEYTDIDYVNLHGTGTKHNDLMEIKALQCIFGDRIATLPISSSKSMIGHTLGAAGAIEAVISVMAIHKGFLPPSLNFKEKIKGYDYTVVEKAKENVKLKNVLSNSFGFGGNCASLIFSNYEKVN